MLYGIDNLIYLCYNSFAMSSIVSGNLITLVGGVGSGKTTEMGLLLAEPGFLASSNTTTRSHRPSDIDHEYRYVDTVEYDRLLGMGRLVWHTVAGYGDHYGKDICDVIEALTDTEHTYVHHLAPSTASTLANRYGPELVKTIYLPSPPREEVLARLILRGDDPDKAAWRLDDEAKADWHGQAMSIDNIYAAKSTGIADRHQEILDYLAGYSPASTSSG